MPVQTRSRKSKGSSPAAAGGDRLLFDGMPVKAGSRKGEGSSPAAAGGDRLLFDGMPVKTRSRKGEGSSPVAAGGDRLSALPDDLLCHVLSFLPAEDAVQTSKLARRWRHLWKSATSLNIDLQDVDNPEDRKEVLEFVDHLLLLRGGLPLDTCKLILSGYFEDNDIDISRVKHWIQHILMCKVRVLKLDILDGGCCTLLDRLTLTSDHLKKLQLSNIAFKDKIFDFSCCPALEVLDIADCVFMYADKISLQSIKFLKISSDCCFGQSHRTHIYAPNLQSLRLDISDGRTPVLERMPCLVEAFVNICDDSWDCCRYSNLGNCENDCFAFHGVDGDTVSVVLQGLSEAQNLVLTSDIDVFIFRRDLKWCPLFGNLKSLLLNENWCEPNDFNALAYMIEHSPILEKLTLQLFCKGHKSKFEIAGKPDPTKRPAVMSAHLNIVEVKCEVVDGKVFGVLKFLSKLGIYMYRFSS